MFGNLDGKQFIIFTIMNFIYVVMNVTKSILQIKGTKIQSSTISCITYGFYTIIVKQISQVDYFTCVVGTMISNLIGDYIGRLIGDKLAPRPSTTCFKIKLNTIKEGTFIPMLNEIIVGHKLSNACKKEYSMTENGQEEIQAYSIYSHNKEEDDLIMNFIINNNIRHYHTEKD